MKIISHRGNLAGSIPALENSPAYIDRAIEEGFDVEIDLRIERDGQMYLGHDSPDHPIDEDWLLDRSAVLWIHAKNMEAARYLADTGFRWFWHQEDTLTMTSEGIPWLYPGNYMPQGIVVELDYMDLPPVRGVCTDDPLAYRRSLTL